MRKTLTTKAARALKPRAKPYVFSDPELRQHYVRVSPTGRKSFAVITYTQAKKQKWITVGDVDVLEIEEARGRAREIILRVRDGLPPVEAPEHSFEAVALDWMKRHIVKNGVRSEQQIRRRLSRASAFWKDRTFLSIRRSDVAALLDHIEDNHGPAEADNMLSALSSMMNWFARRDDDYRPPIVRGMHRYNTRQRARTRILDDDEIRALWQATADGEAYHNLVRLALLTAQRHTKIATIRWDDISDQGEWTIQQAPREKSTAGSLVLPRLALDVISAQPHLGDSPYVFATRDGGPVSRTRHWNKQRLDARLFVEKTNGLPGFKPWVIHDLRRTARSLMSRAGVPREIAERVLGHVVGNNVEATYDRHSYRDEKADALARLAALIDGIVNPRPDVVVPITKKRAKQ